MALLWTESFDFGTAFQNRYADYNYAGLVTGRTGKSFAVNNGGNRLVTPALSPSSTTAIVGVAFWTSGFGDSQGIIQVKEGSTLHAYLYLDTSGYLKVYNGGGSLLGTASTTLTTSTWYYVEFKVAVHSSTGSFAVQVDGAPFGGLTASGQNTRNGATGQWDTVKLNGYGGNQMYDDLYIADGAGSLNNDFLGNTKILAVVPQTDAVGGAGAHQDFTPSTGTDHGALVDDATGSSPNDDTDYLSSSTVNHIETLNYPALGISGTIAAVNVMPYLKKLDAGVRTVATVSRVGSTDYVFATSFTPPTSYGHRGQLWETNPATGNAWAVSEVDGAQFGLKVIS